MGVSHRNHRWVARLARANCVVVLVVLVLALVVDAVADTDAAASFSDQFFDSLFVPVILALAVLGALIVPRHPDNLLGPLMSVVSLLIAVVAGTDVYATHGLLAVPEWPAARYVGWVSSWLWVPAVFPLMTFLLLLCPNGNLPSRTWRPVAWLTAIALVHYSLGAAFSPGPLTDFKSSAYPDGPDNPLGLESASLWVDSLLGYSFVLLVPAIVLSAAAVVVRFRRSLGRERQQLKWFVSAAVGAMMLFLLSLFVDIVTDVPDDDAWVVTFPLAAALLPAATGIAILRHQLYDIDRIINRTLVYVTLSRGSPPCISALSWGCRSCFDRSPAAPTSRS